MNTWLLMKLQIMTNMAEDESVVHAVSALGVPYIGIICNCDMDVCTPYLHRVRLGISEPFHKGHYVTVVNEQKCVGCGTCEQACSFGAITVDSESGDPPGRFRDCVSDVEFAVESVQKVH